MSNCFKVVSACKGVVYWFKVCEGWGVTLCMGPRGGRHGNGSCLHGHRSRWRPRSMERPGSEVVSVKSLDLLDNYCGV